MPSDKKLDKNELFSLLKVFDEEASKNICLVAVGGTAMTLLDLKLSTKDIDFTVPSADKPEFDRVRNAVPHGYKIDVWTDGTIFCITLPDDYIDRSIDIISYKKIHLKALHPLDIVVSKIARLDSHDIEDIGVYIKNTISAKKIYKKEQQQRSMFLNGKTMNTKLNGFWKTFSHAESSV